MRISDPMELKIGDIFYECEYGINFPMTVTEEPVFDSEQWKWKAVNELGYEVNYLITKGFEHYGPKIYSMPVYTGR